MTNERILGIGYVRVSDEKQKGASPEDQRAAIEAEAAADGVELAAIYEDLAISAWQNEGRRYRPGFEQAKRHADADPNIEVLYVTDADRLSRTVHARLAQLAFFRERGTRVKETRTHEYLSDQTAEGMTDIRALFDAYVDENESFTKHKRGVQGIAGAARRGKAHQGGRRRYGYSRPENEIVPEEAAVIRRQMDESYLAGTPIARIARELNDRGVPTVTGARWIPATVRNILDNAHYAGAVTLHGEIVTWDGDHDAIRTRETQEQIWRLRDGVRNTAGLQHRPARKDDDHLFLDGMLRCARCGAAMHFRRRGDRLTYECSTRRYSGKAACDQAPVKARDVDTALFQHWGELNNWPSADELRREITADAERELADALAITAAAERDLATAEDGKRNAQRIALSGALSEKDTAELIELANDDLAAAERRLADARARESEWTARTDLDAETAERIREIRQAIEGTVRDAKTLDEVRAALLRTYDSFTLTADPEGTTAVLPVLREDVRLEAERWLEAELAELPTRQPARRYVSESSHTPSLASALTAPIPLSPSA